MLCLLDSACLCGKPTRMCVYIYICIININYLHRIASYSACAGTPLCIFHNIYIYMFVWAYMLLPDRCVQCNS